MHNKIKFWLPALVLMLGIFYFSAQPAEVSGSLSGGISYRFVKMADDILGLDWSEKQIGAAAEMIDFPVRKLAHLSEYALLGISIAFGIRFGSTLGGCAWKRQYLFSQVIGSLYAASDEFHQLFVPGRAGRTLDVLIDSVGVLIGWWVFRGLAAIMRKRRKHSE